MPITDLQILATAFRSVGLSIDIYGSEDSISDSTIQTCRLDYPKEFPQEIGSYLICGGLFCVFDSDDRLLGRIDEKYRWIPRF